MIILKCTLTLISSKTGHGFLPPVEQPGIQRSTAQLPSVCAASSTLPSPPLPSSYEPCAPAPPSTLCLSKPQHLPITWFFVHRTISSEHFKRVTEIWRQDTPTFLLRALMWKSLPDLTVGMKWKYTLVAHETPDKFFSGSKNKAAKEGWRGKEIKPSPPSQASLQPCLMLSGVLASYALTRSVHPGQRTGWGETRGSKGARPLFTNQYHKCFLKLLK